MDSINTILIAGACHGNELTGLELVRKWSENPKPLIARGIQIDTLLANPEAARKNVRYIHQDLNRSFSQTELSIEGSSLCYEINLAKKINAQFGPKGPHTKTDFLIDIHNTTASMGHSIILSEKNPFAMRAAAILTREFPSAKIYFQPEAREESPYLGTIARADICLEVGAQVHGTLRASLFESTEKIVLRILELAALWNQNGLSSFQKIPVEIFTQLCDIDYPRDSKKNITAMIHPNLEDKNYSELKLGDPLFKTFDGKDILYSSKIVESVWPIFIGEAAYYEKKIAMSLTKKSIEVW